MKEGDVVYYCEPGLPFKVGVIKGFFSFNAPYVLFCDEKHNWIVRLDKLELANDL